MRSSNKFSISQLRDITRDYRVKVSTPSCSRGFLVGALGLVSIFGIDMAYKLSLRASASCGDKAVFKPHGYKGIKVSFYYK